MNMYVLLCMSLLAKGQRFDLFLIKANPRQIYFARAFEPLHFQILSSMFCHYSLTTIIWLQFGLETYIYMTLAHNGRQL
jgi:hypothetical protein